MNCCPHTTGRRGLFRHSRLVLSGSRSREPSGAPHGGCRTVLRARGTVRNAVILLGFCVFGLFARESLGRGDETPEMRTWTSAMGSTVQAALLEVEGETATLRRADDSDLEVKIDKLSAADQEYIGQWLDRRADRPRDEWRQFTNRATGQQFEGKILERVRVRGQIRLYVEDRTGLRAWLPEFAFEITDLPEGDEAPTEEPQPKPEAPKPGEPPPSSTGDQPQPRPSSVQGVFVTGTGVDPEEARRNAFSAAIEQVVGVLVDAETLVNNDELVKDEILTFTRGYINHYTEISRRQEHGLHYVDMRVMVSVDKLGNKLEALPGMDKRRIDGALLAAGIIIANQNQDHARQMFRRATADFSPDKTFTVSVSDLPFKYDHSGQKVTLTVTYRLTPNLDVWQSIQARLKSVLDHVALRKGTGTAEWGQSPSLVRERTEVDLRLFEGANRECTSTYWHHYALPDFFESEARDLARRQLSYQVRLALLDDEGREVMSIERPLGVSQIIKLTSGYNNFRSCAIGPLPYVGRGFHSSWDSTAAFSLDVDQLQRVAECAAVIKGP